MREVNIDLSNLDPQYDCGHCGEANATNLIIDVSTLKNNASFLVVVFRNGYAETYCSERYDTNEIKNNKISVPLWDKLTKTEKEVAIVEAYSENENGSLTILNKSNKINLYFEGSISSDDIAIDTEVKGLYKELIELENRINDDLDVLAAQVTLVKTATDNANNAADLANAAVNSIEDAKNNANIAAIAANKAKINADNAAKAANTAKAEAEQAAENANNAADLATTAVNLIEDAKNNANAAADAANKAKTSADNAVKAANEANEAATKTVQIANGIDNKIENALSSINITTEITSTIEGYIGYEGFEDVLGLQVDYENKVFTRLAGAVGKNAGTDFDSFAMYGGRKRCNVADDGTITAYYGDTNYTDDGTNGQVMVYQPKFYYKVVPLKLDKNVDTGTGYHIRKANYFVSDTQKAGFKLHPAFYDENGNEVDHILYSAYEGVFKRAADTIFYSDATFTGTNFNLETDLIYSIAQRKPISGQNLALDITNAEKLCSNRGNGWHNETIKSLSANQLLMMIEYGAMDMQTAIGQGICKLSDVTGKNCACNTGATRTLGNVTGNATLTYNITDGVETTYRENGYLAVTYRGVENPYGNIAQMISGINYKSDGDGANRVYIADDFNFDVNKTDGNYHSPELTVANDYGYINAFGYDEKYDWLFMPSEIGGTSILPVGDRLAVVPGSTVNKIVLNGGLWNQSTYCGAFHTDLQSNYNQAMRMNGCRLVYIPTAD